MAYYTYEGDNLVLVNDPPNAVYVPRDANGDGNIRYYILDSAGRMVGSTLTPPPSGTRVAPASAMGENGQIDVSQIPPLAGKPVTTPQMADIQNSLAQGGIYNSPDGKYSIIGGGDANTPNLPSAFAGKPRILISGGGSANGVVPPEIASAFPMAPQGEQQHFAQQKATYEAGEGIAPTFMDAAIAAVGSYFGGSALGGMLGGAESVLPAGVGGIDSGSMSQILGNGAYGPGGAFAPGMVDVMDGTESAITNTAAQSATNVGGYTPPVEINPIQNSAAGITETQLPPLNPEPVLPPTPPVETQIPMSPEQGWVPPVETQLPMSPEQGWVPETLPPTIQPTNAAGQAIGAGAAAAAGIGATQAAGAGLTASQLLSGASTAVGAGGLLSSFMNSVGANPLMKALLTGQGIAGIVSGLTSTNGLMSPQEAQAMADPFASSRQQYITQLNALMANPALTTSTPGYQFNLQQGLAGIEAKQAKGGVSRTPAGDIAVQQYGQQQAMSSFDQQVANLSKLSGASQSPGNGAQAALTAQDQMVKQRNAGMQAIGQGIGAIGQAQIPGVRGTQPGGYSMPNGWSMTDPNVNTNYTQGYDPNTPSMQPMGGYIADPTLARPGTDYDMGSSQTAAPQNFWGA